MRTTRKKKAMKKYKSNKRKIMMLTENYKQDKMITMRKRKRMTMTMILMTTLLMTTPGTHYLIIYIII